MKAREMARRVTALLVFGMGCLAAAHAQSQGSDPTGAVTLVATPRLVDADYRAQSLAAPTEDNRHVGVIINRPRTPHSLFPTPRPGSCAIRYFGGPMLRQAVSPWSTDQAPGPGRYG
jgi:hypothetical protein